MEFQILFTREQLRSRTIELGASISRYYKPGTSERSPLHLVGIQTGSFIFLADLVREITIPHVVHLVRISDLEQKSLSGITHQSILVVDDIADRGTTLAEVVALIGRGYPACIKTCALIVRATKNPKVDFSGFEILTDKWLVGWGMDRDGYRCNGLDRGLPYIGLLEADPDATFHIGSSL